MKKYWLFNFLICISINFIALDSNNLNAQKNLRVMTNDDYAKLLSKDSIFVTNCQLDLIIQEQIVNGNFGLYKDTLRAEISAFNTMTYCEMLEKYVSGSNNLKLYLNAQCENSKIRNIIKNKHKEYWSLPSERRVAIKRKIKADLNLRPTKLELELIFENRIKGGNR